MSNFPSDIDTDAELPRADDNITNVTANVVNAIRDAIVAIEEAIGRNPQGATASLVNRLAVALNDDGTIKAAALAAAGLVTLPIVNSQVGSSAAIKESKLDLDFPTASLQTDIVSNDVDIEALQIAVADLLNRFGIHISGLGLKHDSFDILLDSVSPSITPPAFVSLTAVDVGNALIEINNRFIDHADVSKIGAHKASNISVNNVFETFSATEVQAALEGLDRARSTELIIHRDDMHANGFVNNASDIDGYSSGLLLIPTDGYLATASILAVSPPNIIDFSPLLPVNLSVRQSDVVLVYNTGSHGAYQINDVGPRAAIGLKPALTSSQVEITGIFPVTGAVSARVFSKSSIPLLKGNGAPTVYQSDLKVDSIQLSRPNAARVVTLGITPQFVTSGQTLVIQAGVGPNRFRTVTITNLHFDRSNSPAPVVTIDSIIERINYVFENRVDGNAFPAAAYRIGDEIQIAHNWVDSFASIYVSSTGTANFYMGLDEFGANVLDGYSRPTSDSVYYVNGIQRSDYTYLVRDTASVAGNTFTFTTVNPVAAGVKIGHLLHLKSHNTTSQLGTYFVLSVTSSTVTVAKNAGIIAQSLVDVEILHDVAPLNEFANSTRDTVLEVYLTSTGTLGVNERCNYTDVISNLSIVDVSDNFRATASTVTLQAATSGSSVSLTLDNGKPTYVSSSFVGNKTVFNNTNVESITVNISGAIGTGSSSVNIAEHIDEEEALEICSVRVNGLLTASKIIDKRLFGSLGLEELREDVVQAYIETPIRELRSNGVVYGFDVLDSNYTDLSFPGSPAYKGLLVRGGVAYCGGVRNDVRTASVMFPNTAATYSVGIDALGVFQYYSTSTYSVEQLLDGYAGDFALVAVAVHDGTNVTSVTDSRFFIDNVDQKLELIIDETNHFIGQFATFDAAKQYINNWPRGEKLRLRVVSKTNSTFDTTGLNKEIVLVIDGQIGNLIVGSNCKIVGEQISHRQLPHISGTLTIASTATKVDVCSLFIRSTTVNVVSGSVISFDNVAVDGTVPSVFQTIGSTLESIKLSNVNFFSGFTSVDLSSVTTGTVIVEKSGFNASASGVQVIFGGDRVIVDRCGFQNVSAIYSGTGNISVRSSRFKTFANTSASAVLSLSSALYPTVDSCVFSGMTVSTNPIVSVGTTGLMSNCLFSSCVAIPSILLALVAGTIENTLFTGCTFTTSAAIRTDQFHNNRLVSPSNECLVQTSIFVGNNGFHAVQPGTAGVGLPLRLVRDNTFPANSLLGYAIDLGSTGASDGPLIAGNRITTSSVGIKLNNSPFHATITDNLVSGVGTALDFGGVTSSDLQVIVSANTFTCSEPFSSSGAVKGILIQDNILQITSGSFTFGSNVQIEGNLFTGGAFTFTSGGAVGCRIIENVFKTSGVITIGSMVEGLFAENYIDDGYGSGSQFSFGGSYVNTLIEKNIAPISFALSSTANGVVFSDNVGKLLNSSNMEWRNSEISGNIIKASSGLTFNFFSDLSSNNANVFVRSNLFNDNISITSTNPMHGFSFEANGCLDTGGVPLLVTFVSSVNASRISGNFNLSLTFAGGAQATIISENIMLGGAITLQSSISSVLVNSNYSSTMDVECNSSGGLVLSDNFVADNMNMLNLSAGQLSIDGATVTGNYVVNNFNTMSATTDGYGSTNLAVTNSLFSTNRISQIHVLDITNTTGAGAIHNFSGNKFLQNVVVGSVDIFDTSTSLTYSRFANNRFSDNDFNGPVAMRMKNTASANIAIENINFDSNVFSSSVTWSGEWDADGLYLKNNIVKGDISFILDNASASARNIQNVSIIGNVFHQNITVEKSTGSSNVNVSNIKIDDNVGQNGFIQFKVTDLSPSVWQMTNSSISRNICSKINFDLPSASYLTWRVDGFKIDGNILNFTVSESGINLANSNGRVGNISFAFGSISNNSTIVAEDAQCIITCGTNINSSVIANNNGLDFNFFNGYSLFATSGYTSCIFTGNQCVSFAMSDFTVDASIFTGNIIGAQMLFSLCKLTSAEILFNSIYALSITDCRANTLGIKVSQNTITYCLVSSSNATLSDVEFSGNTFKDGSFSYSTQIVNSVSFTGNSVYAAVGFTASTSITGLGINGNTFNNCSVSVLTGSSSGLSISRNTVNNTSSQTISVLGTSFLANTKIDGNNLGINSGAQTTYSVTSGIGAAMAALSFSGNQVRGTLTTNSGATMTGFIMANNSISGTSPVEFTSSNGIVDFMMNGNAILNSILFSAGFLSSCIICNNSLYHPLPLPGSTFDLTGISGSISKAKIHSNEFNVINLPDISVFNSGSDQSLIYFNSAATWTAPFAFATNGSTNVFPWGNTSKNTSTNVDFTGITATNTGTANNVRSVTSGGISS